MKRLAFLLTLSTFSVSALAQKTQTASKYTDMKADCIVVSQSTDESPIDFYSSECKSFGGYTLRESGSDLRYGPELNYQDTEIDLQRPGTFHNLGSQKIEWIYDITQGEEGDGEINFKALIYRLSVADINPTKKDKSILYVVRLNKEKSCLIGTVSSNEAARKLANDSSAKCVNLDR
ncbi:MAG: hypothetical protein ACM3MG_06485 [Bacillota bacterium]